MGKGIIKSGGDAGLYNVELTLHRERIGDTIAIIDAQIVKLDAKISEMEIEILILEMVIWAMPEGNEKEKKKKELKVLVDKKDLEKLKRASYQKRKDYLQDNMPEDPTVSAWCGDLTEDLSGNVGTIEIPGERGIAQIQPGYESNAVYNKTRDAQLQPAIAGTPESTCYNLAMLPGWQKWMPTYRHGIISNIDIGNDTCDVMLYADKSSQQGLSINQESKLSGIPIEYMSCNASAFEDGDSVLVKFEGQEWSGAKVVGFKDNPKPCAETVYVVMQVGSTEKCFVWNVKDNVLAGIEKNDGEPASFPCDPENISDWVAGQSSVGDPLISVQNCGRTTPSLMPTCTMGDFGDAGSNSNSNADSSECGCDFTDTAECENIWALDNICEYPPPLGRWGYHGTMSRRQTAHILWGGNWSGVYRGSRKVEFKNNSEIESAFRIELEHEHIRAIHTMDDLGCEYSCMNATGEYSLIESYKFHTPIENNILQINHEYTGSFDMCANSGSQNQIDYPILIEEVYPIPAQLKSYGAYSKRTIAQVYFVEVQTLTRDASCCEAIEFGGVCWGTGCIGGNCPWGNEVYTCHGLSVAAQVDLLEGESYPNGTDGVDPTQLPRNLLFENAINELYNSLRIEESIPDDKIAGARFSKFWIFKG